MPGYRHHALFERPTPAQRIWRYMSFAKFADLCETAAMYFARADMLSDTREGTLSLAVERRQLAELSAGLAGSRSVLSALEPGFEPRSLAGLADEYRLRWRRQRRRMFVSCWHLCDGQSEAMWRSYGGGDDGAVALQSTFARLERALPAEWDHAIYAGRVRYIDMREDSFPAGNGFLRMLHKPKRYAFERELRAVFDTHSDTALVGFRVPLDLAVLVQRVVVRAGAAPAHIDRVAEVAARAGIAAAFDAAAQDDHASGLR